MTPRRITHWRFRPHPLLTVFALLLMALTFYLALWQFSRADEKRALEQQAQTALTAAPLSVSAAAPLDHNLPAFAHGHYLPEHEILIDNRIHQRQAGFHVITPLQLSDGSVIAVNRGWVAAGANRRAIPPPPPAGDVMVRGVLQKDQADAFTLSTQTEDRHIWQNLRLSTYLAATGLPLLTLALQLTATSSTMPPAPIRLNFKSAQSIGYAWQWLTFCALTAIFYGLLGLRRGRQ